jgi:hypothetical protein
LLPGQTADRDPDRVSTPLAAPFEMLDEQGVRDVSLTWWDRPGCARS